MEKTRLLSLFRTLNNKENRGMQLFLASPFFNKRSEVSLLFDYLVDTIHTYQLIPTKDKAFKYIVSKQKEHLEYDDQQMRLWMRFLLKAIEKFLLQQKLFVDEVQNKKHLATIYRERNLPKLQERTLKELQSLQGKSTFRNVSYYETNFDIQNEQYYLLTATARMSDLNLQDLSDNLDIIFVAKKLRQFCLALSHQSVYKTSYHFGMLEEILSYVESSELTKIPVVAVYYYAYQTMAEKTESTYFKSFKESITNYGEQFSSEELRDLYILAINYCIKKYNEGERKFLKDQFELYQHGLAKKLLFVNNRLSRFSFRNIATIGIVQKEFEWVDNFIVDYKSKLAKKYQESMVSFCMAQLEYSRKNYDTALQLLQKSEYKDLLLNLAAKTLQLKIFYELQAFDLLIAHLEAMTVFIRRKKVMGYHQTNYLNLIQFTKRLIETNPYDKNALVVLRNEIAATKAVAQKDWLSAIAEAIA